MNEHIRTEIVDAILEAMSKAADDRMTGKDDSDATATAMAMLSAATPAEAAAVFEVLATEAESQRRFVAALVHDPDSVAAERELAELTTAPDDESPACFDDLPDSAALMLYLQKTWPWPPEIRDQVTGLAAAWTDNDRALFTKRFGWMLTDGCHWI